MRVLFFLDYIQDADLLLPLARRASTERDFGVSVCFTGRLARQFPGAASDFRKPSLRFEMADRWKVLMGLAPDLGGVDALVTASESSLAPHVAAHALTRRADRKGIKTYTIQHGFEHAGLTYFDEKDRPGTVRFASRKIFVWGELSLLHAQVPESVRSRCVPAGCPKSLSPSRVLTRKPEGRPFMVSVFENLHWRRYDDGYRRFFTGGLKEMAAAHPDTTFFVRPHPDERWLARHGEGLFSPDSKNLVLADPRSRFWEPYGAASFFGISDGVVTTPSTVALDAARAGVPVAVVAGDLKVPAYEPLFVIRSPEDWISFVRAVRGEPGRFDFIRRSGVFVERVLVPGDAVNRILSVLQEDR